MIYEHFEDSAVFEGDHEMHTQNLLGETTFLESMNGHIEDEFQRFGNSVDVFPVLDEDEMIDPFGVFTGFGGDQQR
jgi:hypothetical protein